MTPPATAATCTELCEHGRTRTEGCKPCFWVGGQCRCQPVTAMSAPFPDGWPTVPSLTVTRDGRVLLAAPLMNERQSFDVGPYKVWVTR